jgi:hypothetical protein
MLDADEVPFPKPRRLRLWEGGRPTLSLFPFAPLRGLNRKGTGSGLTLHRRKRLGYGKGTLATRVGCGYAALA